MGYFLSILILFLSCTTLPEDVPGCTTSSACNFIPDANEDDGSCWFINIGCSCSDGAGTVVDLCGVCDTDPTNDCVKDCNGNWGGNDVSDNCGTCDADSTNNNMPLNGICDCAVEPNGEAYMDGCGDCVGGNTGLDP